MFFYYFYSIKYLLNLCTILLKNIILLKKNIEIHSNRINHNRNDFHKYIFGMLWFPGESSADDFQIDESESIHKLLALTLFLYSKK